MRPLLLNYVIEPARCRLTNWLFVESARHGPKAKQQWPVGHTDGQTLAKRYDYLAKAHDHGFLPNGIGIAIDLHICWSGSGNTQPGYFDNWHEMLVEQVRLLEASTRKDSYKRFKETLEIDVQRGTARAFPSH